MKKVRKIVLCGLILIAGVFNKYVYADVIEDIRKEFCEKSRNFEYNDNAVDLIDHLLCQKHNVAKYTYISPSEFTRYYSELFQKGKGNCRVAAAYFSKKFDDAGIENRDFQVVFNDTTQHTVNLYKYKDQWLIADFIAATKAKAPVHSFGVPLEKYILRIRDSEKKHAVAFGVHNKDNRLIVDLREFIPKMKEYLDRCGFLEVYNDENIFGLSKPSGK